MADQKAWMVGMVEVVRAAVAMEQAAVARDLVGKGSVVGQEVMMEEIAMGVATG